MPSYSGMGTITVDAFLKRPDLLFRRLTDISKKGFIVDALLQTGYNADGGVVPYTRSESIYMDADPKEIAEGSEYPIVGQPIPVQYAEPAHKYGFKTFVTEEAVRRSQLPELERALVRLRNSMIKFIDGQFLARVIADPDIQTRAAAAPWTVSASTIDDDIENSRADVRGQLEGYEVDTIVAHISKQTVLNLNTDLRNAFVGSKAPDNPIFTGHVGSMMGVDFLFTPNIASNTVLVLQRKVIGGIADEVPMEIKTLPFDFDTDRYWMRSRRVTATFLQEPKALVKLTGV